ncbi:MAG: hypothetical protein RBT53_07875 [Azonexus sp.]|jgi:hypothetical protein|nr:hypothetical protein [Azonexus sp.]
MPSPILARADALMHRRPHSNDSAEDFPILTDALDEEENIPILLQVEATPEEPNPEPLAEHTSPPVSPTAITTDSSPSSLAADLAHALHVHLQAALPSLIERAVADVMAHRRPSPAPTETVAPPETEQPS